MVSFWARNQNHRILKISSRTRQNNTPNWNPWLIRRKIIWIKCLTRKKSIFQVISQTCRNKNRLAMILSRAVIPISQARVSSTSILSNSHSRSKRPTCRHRIDRVCTWVLLWAAFHPAIISSWSCTTRKLTCIISRTYWLISWASSSTSSRTWCAISNSQPSMCSRTNLWETSRVACRLIWRMHSIF